MRIYNDTSDSYIHGLAACIERDPASMENWRCLHVGHTEHASFERYEETLRSLKEALKDADCDVIHCADNDVLFISRSMLATQLYDIADELLNSTESRSEEQTNVVLYDLFHDWRTVNELLLEKAGHGATAAPPMDAYDFGDLSSLLEVFSESKKQRETRPAMHMLLVEDDPLTRRIVSNGFKEECVLVTAENAQDAVKNYLLHAPDIMFLDIGLPDQSGFAVLQKIMEIDPAAYVVMFSGNSYLDNINVAFSAGASGFIAKPFRKDKMRHYIADSAMHHRKHFV